MPTEYATREEVRIDPDNKAFRTAVFGAMKSSGWNCTCGGCTFCRVFLIFGGFVMAGTAIIIALDHDARLSRLESPPAVEPQEAKP